MTAFSDARAVLFDLDGVLTPTADIHRKAWQTLFTTVFERYGVAPYTQTDYLKFLDGRQRYEGVNALLLDRGIHLPYGEPSDPVALETVCGLGNRKNDVFSSILLRDGVAPYPGSVALLDNLDDRSVAYAVVSSSKNARPVLKAAGLIDRFSVIVDGVTAADHNLPSKPSPDVFLYGAQQLGAPIDTTAVVEDAISGVQAGSAGAFPVVVGVDREDHASALRDAGATQVVDDLQELIV